MLREFELVVLVKICKEMHMSKARHIPENAIVKRFPGTEREARKALRKLISRGYVGLHPTRGDMNYQLTDIGWDLCRRLKEGVEDKR